jgi:thiol-disulfide isomerase/thioredoxin
MKNFSFTVLFLTFVFGITALLSGCTQPTASSEISAVEKSIPAAETKAVSVVSSILSPYTQATLDALKGKQKFALFFSASWCPKCRATKNAIAETPEKFAGVTLLELDYDTETELKKVYGITLQHSLVFFDANGSIAATAVMPTDDEIIAFFQN